ncbi:MAG: hypothetical protein KGL62_12370 [Bradyrhizobium sp.]|uniref:hypothetical protein n=1 Tax=Bradyrhizobium sp. TaxID=376 RepID=UPI0023A20817|nr:hypothetical protein [Bradyrhizobium sp.]MDE2603145.1 hypothetical protein [Bradyrhizobium sp.]
MLKRRRFKQTETLGLRLLRMVAKLRREPQGTPAGIKREQLIQRAQQAESALRVNGWLNSPGLQPPK